MSRLPLLMAACAALAACKNTESPTIMAAPVQPPAAAAPTAPPAVEPTVALPPGHPPLPGTPTAAAAEGAAGDLQFAVPPAWTEKPPRPMLHKVFAVPPAEGETVGAEMTLSFLGKVPLDMNVARWCGQLGHEAGPDCEKAAVRAPLAGATLPSTTVEIAGTYSGSTMGGPPDGPKPGYRMLVVEIQTADRNWYAKLIGPEKTVAQAKAAFLVMAAGAK